MLKIFLLYLIDINSTIGLSQSELLRDVYVHIRVRKHYIYPILVLNHVTAHSTAKIYGFSLSRTSHSFSDLSLSAGDFKEVGIAMCLFRVRSYSILSNINGSFIDNNCSMQEVILVLSYRR